MLVERGADLTLRSYDRKTVLEINPSLAPAGNEIKTEMSLKTPMAPDAMSYTGTYTAKSARGYARPLI